MNTTNDRLKVLTREWENCQRCPLGDEKHRPFKHVIYETVPAVNSGKIAVLFIGEGPGKSEDVIGQPFIGPAGIFLRETIELCNVTDLPYALTNLVACRPCDSRYGSNRPPDANEVDKCSPRLIELMDIFDPLVIVALGAVPESYVPFFMHLTDNAAKFYRMHHPSYLLRSGGKSSSIYPSYLQNMRNIFEYAEGEYIQEEASFPSPELPRFKPLTKV